ncbi:glycosyltransferase family 4 protein [Corynebacterium pygosceleis]|uniref:Glycosyltransferase family 4 protein n=1 Tax=Corynebacterium pygosceleis TaxID=2800406 RepID=A0A9Q4C9J5_9CORY|nr:glycosyltransferase family 4 protein [Corynebacterium pygosceleis]MCK7638235.1 glycosyltransferase family 4 protein [Corynebacterium pygosceleis]MCK7676243.1 glycosyltransferase family 4 protein [Corynebacterium pygosceleis]MCL0121597.1 glycosyltransferase family 4 protein [Corynebacterium pygosceleis]MCX7445794.1 glycosyltransferase family 4 protein [Corynebacterium pygosceleis]MCX7469391.1 glycosyltransferase family 4 protein [Corynebacterium pygosceleis]
MHILLITQYWEPEQGVVQRRWQWINRALVKAGHELTVICPPPHYPSGVLTSSAPEHQSGAVDRSTPGVNVYRTSFREHDSSLISRIKDQWVIMVSQLTTCRTAVRDARRNGARIDVVCCTVPALPSAPVAYVLSRALRIPLVVELRDAWPEILEYLDEWKDPQPRELSIMRKVKIATFHMILLTAGRALGHILRRADTIITTTESLAAMKRTTATGHVVTVRNRPDTRIPDCSTEPTPSGPLKVLYAGTVGRAQGLENAIEALRIAREKGTSLELRIAGGGAHLKRIKEMAQQHSLPVDFLGRIPFEEVSEQYRWCDTALVHLQSWAPMSATIPSKLFEAMKAEKHITAAVAGEAARIVSEAQVGHVVTPMDPEALAMLWTKLSRNRDLLRTSGNGTAWLENEHTRESSEQDWITALERTLRC